jgi:hypothetical protein
MHPLNDVLIKLLSKLSYQELCMGLQVVIVVAGKVTGLLHTMQRKYIYVHAVSSFTGQKKNPSILNILK